jgi:succinate dehydrogenase / fumarate reductase iron-sulfur subunit
LAVQKLNLKLSIWRQESVKARGRMVPYEVKDISPDMSFLEMLDVLNDDLGRRGELPIEFDSDCREGICGTCGMVINGIAHGPKHGTATCQLHMRQFRDGQTITVEPFRAKAFPVIKDLVIDRSAFDRIISRNGYISVGTGSAPEANSILIPKDIAERAMDAAACIGCGACVAACPNASAALFVGARVSHLAILPQGHPERTIRVKRMTEQMDREGFGDCSNHAECEAVCPKEISIGNIARMRREFWRALFK